MVEKRAIKFDSAKVTRYDRYSDTVYFDLIVKLNGIPQVLKKQFKLSESFEGLRDRMIDEVKEDFGGMNKRFDDDDDLLGSALIVMIDDYEEVEESLVNFFKRVKDKVRQFKSNKSADGYLNMYSSFDNID